MTTISRDERLSALQQQMASKQQELTALAKEVTAIRAAVFAEGAKALFAAHPVMQSFSWTQYTPYWNDGEECTFRTYTDSPDINGDEVPYETTYTYDDELPRDRWGNRQTKKVPNPDYNPALSAAQAAVAKFMQQFDDDHLKAVFGDHARVTVTADGASVDEYNHE